MSSEKQDKVLIVQLERALASLVRSLDKKYNDKRDYAEEFTKIMNEFEDLIDQHADRDAIKKKWRAIDGIISKANDATSLKPGVDLSASLDELRYELSSKKLNYDYLAELYYEARRLFDYESKFTIHAFDTTIMDHIKVNTKFLDRGTATLEGLKEKQRTEDSIGGDDL
jgi:hypothetical protein